ncbi:hypothetical protein ACF0H5_015563 [Mactra antiquata]
MSGIFCVCLIVFGIYSSMSVEASSRPHILFIVADDLGWNDVSWHNSDVVMPTLDKMAKKGVILNSSYVQPQCSPSRGALMTGYYPFHIGMQHGIVNRYQPKYMPQELETLPEALKKVGYSTHMVGKWHLGFCNWNYTPTYRGFDSFYGFYSGAEDYYTHKHYGGYDFRFNTSVHYPPKMRYSTTLFGQRSRDIILEHSGDDPLFLYLSFQGVHSPLQVPKKYSNQYSHIGNKNRRIYSGMITAMDDAVSLIMRSFQQKRYTDNLLVVFTSDNGGASYMAGSNWPLRGAKSTLWEGGTRVPTFVYSNTLLKKTGIVNNGLVHVTDWFPTLVKLAGGETNPFLDGVDQWLSLSRSWPSKRTEFVYNINEVKNSAAIRYGDYKLIVGSPGRYNNWYPVKTKPACNSKEAKQGYIYEDRQMSRVNKLDRQEQKAVNGWWFTSPLKYIKKFAERAAEVASSSNTWRRLGQWYDKYRCDRFREAHIREEKSLKPPPLQLFNIKDDPEEKFNLADRKKILVKKIMRKLKYYKKTLVKAQNQAATKLAHPNRYDGIWSPGWC